uniref:Uncharacterized protein n=1 Tax=Rhizophagus irregularis (strain DAOM 181602 / DAOM 197198 / MUCL 43194) TaxID=747089 RepID=U9SR04_RHIID
MNKNFAVYLFLLGLIIYVHAADVMVNVGNAKGENVFEPAKILALPGDNVVFTWVSGKHSVIETDSLTACAKSEKPNAFTSDGAFMAPKTWTIPIPYDAAGGKTWFFCGVPGHCTPGTGGMAGTLILIGGGAPPGGAAPATAAALSYGSASTASPSAAANNNTSNTPNMVGAIIGSLIVPGHNNTEGYNNGQEATTISVNENQVHNDTNTYNHGQEVITIPENNDNNNLKDYITQIVRQELMQNQGK